MTTSLTTHRPNPHPVDGPGTEDELNAIEQMAEAMWQASGVILYGADWDADGWEVLDEKHRQEYRNKAETWVQQECDRILESL